MTKNKLYLDFDGVIANTIKSVCQIYTDKYKDHKDFKIPYPCLETTWNFHTQCPLFSTEEVEAVFNDKKLFEYLQPFPDTVEVLERLNNHYQIIIVTIGGYENISLKCKYIKETLPFVHDFIGLTNKNCDMDKSLINMSGSSDKHSIFVDDNDKNLFSQQKSTNLIRFCYAHNGTVVEWNENWFKVGGRTVSSWLELEKELMKWVNK